eukprot:1190280-Prorocentrum_minimum.AAC.3
MIRWFVTPCPPNQDLFVHDPMVWDPLGRMATCTAGARAGAGARGRAGSCKPSRGGGVAAAGGCSHAAGGAARGPRGGGGGGSGA